MEPSEIGPYILLGLGVATVGAAIVGHFKQLPMKNAVVTWVFGLALLGIGSYGPAFLADYTKFIKELNTMVSSGTSDAEQVAELVESARKAGVSKEARTAIVVEALGPAKQDEGLRESSESALIKTLEKLPQESENRAVLQDAAARLKAENEVRAFAARQIEAAAKRQAPALEAEDVKSLLELRDDQLRALRLDRATVSRAMKAPPGVG